MSKVCKKSLDEMEKLFNTSEVMQINADYKDFFNFVSTKTGVDLKTNGFEDMWIVADTLKCEVIVYASCGRIQHSIVWSTMPIAVFVQTAVSFVDQAR